MPLSRPPSAPARAAPSIRSIVLEASKALCFSLRGDAAKGEVHYDRALAACRAIGHRYHESWIERDRRDISRTLKSTVAVERPSRDLTDTALLLNDVATILGAGHSIDLMAHRIAAILQSTSLNARVEIQSESGREYQAEPSSVSDIDPNGVFRIRLHGSDRRVSIHVRDAHTIEEITLLKGLADLTQAAVNRTADTESEDDEQNLWPRTLVQDGDDTVFRSPRMVELLRIAVRLASTPLPVLITGETGTGKEVIARLIHQYSQVKRGPFVPFNCSAMPRDLVESQLFGHRRGAFTGAMDSFPGVIRAAERGTVFLDELADLDPATQPKFLRFLESGEVHPVGDVRPQRVSVRVVAATNADLDDLVDQGRFRRDLFYRVGVARLNLPPLRERKDEIPALAALFLDRFSRECQRTGLRPGDDFIAALLALRLARQHPAARQRDQARRRAGRGWTDTGRRRSRAGNRRGLELAADVARVGHRPGRHRPHRSTAGAGAGRAREEVHRARDGIVRRPRRRRGAAARHLPQGPVPETPAARPCHAAVFGSEFLRHVPVLPNRRG